MRYFKIFSFLILIVCLCYGCGEQLASQNNGKNYSKEKINILSSRPKGDTLRIVSDAPLIWRPFMVDNDPEEIQKHFNDIFEVDTLEELRKLSYGGDFIILIKNPEIKGTEGLAEYRHSKISPFSLVKVEINTPKLTLQYGVQIGMTKKSFFSLINEFSSKRLTNVVQIFDPPGEEITQSYIFEDDKLVQIKMEHPYIELEE